MPSSHKSKTTGSPPRNETPEQAALRRLVEYREGRRRYYANLDRWRTEREAILAKLKPARDRAKRSHEAVMGMSEKINRKKMEIQLLSDSVSEARRRRQKGRRPEDEYHSTISPEEKRRQKEEKAQRLDRLEREVDQMLPLYYSYESEDQAAAKEYEALKRDLEATEGHINSVRRGIDDLDRQIEQLERQLQRAEAERNSPESRDRHRRHDDRDRDPRGPPPGGSGGGRGGRGGSTGAWDQFVTSKHGGRGVFGYEYGY
jgi:chromosome segregation ATPase